MDEFAIMIGIYLIWNLILVCYAIKITLREIKAIREDQEHDRPES